MKISKRTKVSKQLFLDSQRELDGSSPYDEIASPFGLAMTGLESSALFAMAVDEIAALRSQ